MNDLIERLRTRLAAERAAPETGHNAADRERSELIRLLREAVDALAQKPTAVDGAMLRDAERYRALVASGKFAPSFNSGWALATGTYRATKDELDAAIDQARGKERAHG